MLHDLALTTPLLILLFAGLFTLVVDPFLPAGDQSRRFWGPFNAAMSAAAIVAAALMWKSGQHGMQTVAFGAHLSASTYSLFFVSLVSLVGMMTHLSSPKYMLEQGVGYGEYFAMVSFATFGMATMVSAESVITLFIGLEIMSMAIYVLVAFKRTSIASVEAGMKYFIMGSVASALLLYGMAFLYGLSGGTTFVEIQRALVTAKPDQAIWLSLAVLLTLAAFLFKVAAVPFHMWAPDAYEGAPTTVTGFMASGVKVAAFGALLKILYAALAGQGMDDLHLPVAAILSTVALVTMTVGNLLALVQKNVKRMLAYSAIAHAGYLLLGTVASTVDPVLGAPYAVPGGAVPFYLIGYSLASLAGFAALASLGKNGEELTTEHQLAGLGRRYPFAGAVLSLAMLSLAGVPPTLGFFGKLELLREVLAVDNAKYLPHAIILVLNSVVSAYYYLRVTVYVYMRPEPKIEREYVTEPSLSWAMGLAAAAILAIGVMPGKAINVATLSAHAVRTSIATKNLVHLRGPDAPVKVAEVVAAPQEAPAAPAAEAAVIPQP
ncbi:MAG: NADH-quinone oxidoreductase subunit N [Myxococcota bacterium]